jgi:hypothetical protein
LFTVETGRRSQARGLCVVQTGSRAQASTGLYVVHCRNRQQITG